MGYKPKQRYKLSQPALVTVWRKLTEDAHILASLTELNGMKFKPNIRGKLAHANYQHACDCLTKQPRTLVYFTLNNWKSTEAVYEWLKAHIDELMALAPNEDATHCNRLQAQLLGFDIQTKKLESQQMRRDHPWLTRRPVSKHKHTWEVMLRSYGNSLTAEQVADLKQYMLTTPDVTTAVYEVDMQRMTKLPKSRYFEDMIDKLTEEPLWLRVRLRSLTAADMLYDKIWALLPAPANV